MTKRHDRKLEAEREARTAMVISHMFSLPGGCHHKYVQTYKSLNFTRWLCAKCKCMTTMESR